MITNRKDEHVRLALEQYENRDHHNEFDDVILIHQALAGLDRDSISLETNVGPWCWPFPFYINAMTGGSEKTGLINQQLGIVGQETGIPLSTGSLSAYFADHSLANTFSCMRKENPKGFIMANISATTSIENARRAIDLLDANALQIHLNVIQETVMPEGERSFSSWATHIAHIVDQIEVPVIVKEVGFGLTAQTVDYLKTLGVDIMDVSGRGGTNFARIENNRRGEGDYWYMAGWGQSTPACLLDCANGGVSLLGSGGIRHPLDIIRVLALGGSAAGVSGQFLATLINEGVEHLINQIRMWVDHLRSLLTAFGAATPSQLSYCDVLIIGLLRQFCLARGIDTTHLAHRFTYPQSR